MSLDVEINSKQYSVIADNNGNKVSTRPVQQFVQPIRDTGRTRPEDVAAYESFVIPNLAYGFGRARINSDVAFDPKEYRRFFDSTCDTRWMDRIYLPILAETATQTGLEVVRASAELGAETNALWDKDGIVVNRQFTGSSTNAWENGGELNPTIFNSAITDTTGGSLSSTTSFTSAGSGSRLYVFLFINGTASGDAPSPGGSITITYGGDALSHKANSRGGSAGIYLYEDTNPDGGANNLVVSATSNDGSAINKSAIAVVNVLGVSGTAGETAEGDNSIDISTTTGHMVLGASGNTNGGTVSVGAGQTQIQELEGGVGEPTLNTSFETASGGTTTHSYSFGTSATQHTVGIDLTTTSRVSLGLDMIQHKGKLIALLANVDDHRVYFSSDGVTWTAATTDITAGLLVNNIDSDDLINNIDAGLLATIGGELVALVWDEDSGTITAFTSTNSGVAFSDESGFDIASGNGPQGVAVYQDIDGTNKLYVGTKEGLYIVDTSPSTWTYELIMPMPFHSDNCRRMTVHEGALWFAQGVDDDSPAPIYKLTVQGNSRLIESGYGLSYGDGVPQNLHGSVTWMESAGDQLFIGVGGGKSGRNSRILAWNGKGWHSMHKNATVNEKVQWLTVGAGDDSTPRLHFAERTGNTTSDAQYLEQPLVNPRSGASIVRAADGQFIELPYYDLGIPQEDKNFLSAHISADDLTSSDETVEFHYGINGGSRTTTDLGDFTSSVSKLLFGSGAGVSAKDIGITLKLNREDGDTSKTPKIKDIVVEGLVVPSILYEHQLTIDLQSTADETGQGIETVISNLETLLSTVTQTQLKFGQVSKYVTVDRERSGFSFGINSWDASGAPNALSERTGTFNCVLVEKVTS